jgi:hypothetical protein
MRIIYVVLICCFALFLDSAEAGGLLRIDYSLTYSRQGTRSEARHGHLKINDVTIPYGFDRVVAGSESYASYTRTQLWGDDGYHPARPPFFPSASSALLSAQQLQKGFALVGERRQNTPQEWIYVEWKGGRAFVAPESLGVLIKEQGIRTSSSLLPESTRPASLIPPRQ